MEKWVQECLNSRCRGLLFDSSLSLLALDKEAGVLSHPNPRFSKSASAISSSCIIKGSYNFDHEVYSSTLDGRLCKSWLLHRLDKDTSGVILIAFEEITAKRTKMLFKERKVSKEYYSFVVGRPIGKNRTFWEDKYEKSFAPLSNQTRAIRATPGGFNQSQKAVTEVSIECYIQDLHLTLLRMRPITGFAHQLRYQCAQRHIPILGDEVYGDFQANRSIFQELKLRYNKISDRKPSEYKRLYLHSHSIDFDVDWTGDTRRFTATSPLPAAFDWIKST